MTTTPEEKAVLAEFGCDLSEEEISLFMIAMAAHILVQRKSKTSTYARHLEIERDSLRSQLETETCERDERINEGEELYLKTLESLDKSRAITAKLEKELQELKKERFGDGK